MAIITTNDLFRKKRQEAGGKRRDLITTRDLINHTTPRDLEEAEGRKKEVAKEEENEGGDVITTRDVVNHTTPKDREMRKAKRGKK